MRYLVSLMLAAQTLTLGILIALFNGDSRPREFAMAAVAGPAIPGHAGDMIALRQQLAGLTRQIDIMHRELRTQTQSENTVEALRPAIAARSGELTGAARALVDDVSAAGGIIGDDWRRIHSRAAGLDAAERLAVYSEIARAINAGELIVDANSRL